MRADTSTVAEAADTLLADLPPCYDMSLRFEDWTATIRTNSESVIEHLRHYHREFLIANQTAPDCTVVVLEGTPPEFHQKFELQPREPGKDRWKEEYLDVDDGRVIRKVRTSMMFLLGASHSIAIGPCEKNLNQVINFVDSRYVGHLMRPGRLLFHAAGVCQDGFGLAMAGRSGLGKSTLALHLMGAGWDFVSNDRLVVQRQDDRLVMHGLAKQPRVNPGTMLNDPCLASLLPEAERQRLALIPWRELWALEDKYDIDLAHCYGGGRRKLTIRMDALLLFNWRHDGGPTVVRRIDPNQHEDLVSTVRKSLGVFFPGATGNPSGPASIDQYFDLLQSCAVYELGGGVDFEAAVSECDNLMSNRMLD